MRQKLGQHFLRDPHVVRTILAAADLKPSDSVLEIGPGKGVLTRELAGRVARVVAVELDKRLADDLKEQFRTQQHVSVIQSDFLRLNLIEMMGPPLTPAEDDVLRVVAPERASWGPIKIVGNLPYSITSPIFEKILPWPAWDVGVFLVQREVAQRMKSLPGSRTFGVLSLAVQLFAGVETVLQVKPGSFAPPPAVSSTVIRLRRKASLELPPNLQPAFFDLVHAAFTHRRKTVANSLAFFAGAPRQKLEAWLFSHGISPAQRAETIALGDYVRLADAWSIFRREIDLT
jgi:16S rRNA (adenine1518-N6/adenine1519-N6)-dimethyltransferase